MSEDKTFVKKIDKKNKQELESKSKSVIVLKHMEEKVAVKEEEE